MASMVQQIQGAAAGPPRSSVFSRLNFGQSSSNYEKRSQQPPKMLPAHEIPTQVKGKAQIKQVYEKVPAVHAQEVGPLASITIGSARVPIVKINEPIIIEEPTIEVMKEVAMGAATNDQEGASSKRDSKYCQPKWFPSSLSKTKRQKLQCARYHKQKERLEKMREDIINSTHPSLPPPSKNTAKIPNMVACSVPVS
jgi:hypothetical protein